MEVGTIWSQWWGASKNEGSLTLTDGEENDMKHSLRAGASHYQITPDPNFQLWTDGHSIDNTICAALTSF